MANLVINREVASQFRNYFAEYGWININFPDEKKALLATLNPRIDTSREVIIISTPASGGDREVNRILVNKKPLTASSLIITDQRIVVLSSVDKQINKILHSDLKYWQRPAIKDSVNGKFEYRLDSSQGINIVFEVHGATKPGHEDGVNFGVGLIGALLGAPVMPNNSLDMMRINHNNSLIKALDNLMRAICDIQGTIL